MAPPIKVARTASDRKTYNALKHDDTVIILFDLPFGAGDNSAHEIFELSWTAKGAAKDAGKKLSKTRATTEPVDNEELRSWTHDLLASGHVAVRFEGIKPGTYKLTRSDGRKEPEVIFSNVIKQASTPHDALTGHATARRDQPHQYWTFLDDYKEATDPDLKRTPPDVTTLPVPEPRKEN
ncbi:MAG TPA: hypothetical protein VGL72_11175 [Bryobacteraceae bacterium]|jgi:hypothetical protein